MNRIRPSLVLLAILLAPAAAQADELRNVAVGEPVPPFTLRTLDGGELSSRELAGHPSVLVYVSAEQRSSETAMRLAAAVGRDLRDEGLSVAFLTADATRVGYFRRFRDQFGLHEFPLGIDVGREVYGGLGLIVLPTTVVLDAEGRLAHVISSCRSDYEPVLRAYARHTLGLIDDARLAELLTARDFQRDRPEDRIARHRAAARLLREKGLRSEAEQELIAALEIDATHAGARLDLATLRLDQGAIDAAGTLVTAVLATDPDHRRAKLVSGVVLYHRGRLDEAERTLTETLLLNPDPVLTHYYLGLVKERQGDETAALAHLKEALSRLLETRPM